MRGNSVNYYPLLDPPKEPGATMVWVIDSLTWALPMVAVLLSIGGGLAALDRADGLAAGLGIAAGIPSAGGVWFTNWASRIRDGRLEIAHAKGDLAIDMAEQAQTDSDF